jgi:hypothetical protein
MDTTAIEMGVHKPGLIAKPSPAKEDALIHNGVLDNGSIQRKYSCKVL